MCCKVNGKFYPDLPTRRKSLGRSVFSLLTVMFSIIRIVQKITVTVIVFVKSKTIHIFQHKVGLFVICKYIVDCQSVELEQINKTDVQVK